LTAQCPAGQTNVDITYTTGGFNGENGWALWDATAGVVLACDSPDPAGGTTSVCITDGNTIELQGFESFGDGWCAPANISVDVNETGIANGASGQMANLYSGNTTASGNGVYDCASADPTVNPGGTVDPIFPSFTTMAI